MAKKISINKVRRQIAVAYHVSVNESSETPIGLMLAYRKAA